MSNSDSSGIPDNLTTDFIIAWVRPRVSDKRFKHIIGVVKIAAILADKASVDKHKAEIAAWLHDACKEMKPHELIEKAKQMKMAVSEIEMQQGHLLHGPVASLIAKQELNLTNEEVLNAISEHTLGKVPMNDLSKVIFLADCLDETRPADYTRPIWQALDIDGNFNMNAAIVMACNLGIQHLIESGKTIHPRTVEVRNYYANEDS
jgi:predicted HD superfamily hydrolase involved in NAD metabolism